MRTDLLDLLLALDTVPQDPAFHPEGDALYHSLQVFDLARKATDDRQLWAAALLHDVGKALGSAGHAEAGADLLDGLIAPRVVWLVRHHLDLLLRKAATKRRLRGTPSLRDLTRLRDWDVQGRSPRASVLSPDEAVDLLLAGDLSVLAPEFSSSPLMNDDDYETEAN